MKFLISDWPVGQFNINNDFIRKVNAQRYDDYIDTSLPQWAFLLTTGLAGGRVPPVSAVPLDAATYNAMVAWYGVQSVLRVPT